MSMTKPLAHVDPSLAARRASHFSDIRRQERQDDNSKLTKLLMSMTSIKEQIEARPDVLIGLEVLQLVAAGVTIYLIPKSFGGVVAIPVIHVLITLGYLSTLVPPIAVKYGSWLEFNVHWVDFGFMIAQALVCFVGLAVYTIIGSSYYSINIECNLVCNNVVNVASSAESCVQYKLNGVAKCSNEIFNNYSQSLSDYGLLSWTLVGYLVVLLTTIYMTVGRVAEHIKEERLFPTD
ncbi:hypothetical protein BC831DRAFT_461142 [Entophlyctis helioformis]|nr:hypothetical protein BC831DRAFT_461142 [Entophlyctis helioformis]